MDSRVRHFFDSIYGKKISFCGIGISNLPLCALFAKYGARVIACDRKDRQALGEFGQKLEEYGIALKCGPDYLENLDVDIIFRTPGIYYNMEKLQQYRRAGVVVTSEMEVFFDLCPCKIYGVTGSDGKTTTTTLISEMLKKSGRNVYLGGNIGIPLLPQIEKITADDVAVAELSSFQLISMRKSPDVAVITNLAPNHLNVHKTMEEYVDAKKNLILHQNAFSRTVLNADNDITAAMQPLARGECSLFSRRQPVKNGAFCDEQGRMYLVRQGVKQFVMHKSDIRIPGEHNVENYLAAMAAVADEVESEEMVEVAKTFGGVEHRIEFVRELDGVRYYNDSIATSPSRVIAGLKAFGRKIIVIAGGYDKDIPYGPLGPYLTEFVKTLVLLGATADKIEAAAKAAPDYEPGNPEIIRVQTLEQAVAAARNAAGPGDIVTLSPASASFDLYRNFEERGQHFKRIVNELA